MSSRYTPHTKKCYCTIHTRKKKQEISEEIQKRIFVTSTGQFLKYLTLYIYLLFVIETRLSLGTYIQHWCPHFGRSFHFLLWGGERKGIGYIKSFFHHAEYHRRKKKITLQMFPILGTICTFCALSRVLWD